jgi:hypothetical protein
MAKADREEWAKRVQHWKDSGLSAREFEVETGLKASSLTYWRWKLKKEQAVSDGEQPAPTVAVARKKAPKPLQFVELSSFTSAVSDDRFELVVGAFTIRVPSRFDDKSLRKLLAIVAERP